MPHLAPDGPIAHINVQSAGGEVRHVTATLAIVLQVLAQHVLTHTHRLKEPPACTVVRARAERAMSVVYVHASGAMTRRTLARTHAGMMWPRMAAYRG